MVYWKLLYAALQIVAFIIPALRKDRGVDMRPLEDVYQDRLWYRERARLKNLASKQDQGTS